MSMLIRGNSWTSSMWQSDQMFPDVSLNTENLFLILSQIEVNNSIC